MYLTLKFVHVLAVVMFVGNITIGIFWKQIADATNDPRVIAHTIGGIMKADRIFTIPAVILLAIAGVGTAQVGQLSILGTGWIVWSIGLFIIAGVAFGPIARAQRGLYAVAQAGTQGATMDWQRYEAVSKQWALWGTIATIAPLIAVALMVLKPVLPAF